MTTAALRGSLRPTDVLVVGAGPAGSTTASLLSRRGWRVTVLDRARFPRPKACGECLNPGAVRALARMGLLERVERLSPARLSGWEIRSGATSAAADFPARGRAVGLAVARASLDAVLVDAARASGAQVLEGVHVTGLSHEPAARRVVLLARSRDGEAARFRARVVVGADGLRSVVSRAIGAPLRRPKLRRLSLTVRVRGKRHLHRRGTLSVGTDCTVGLAPVVESAALWNLTAVLDSRRWGRAAAADPSGLVLRLTRARFPEWLDGPDVLEGPWASGPFDWPTRHVVADRVVLVGDAAGYFDPLTGQGIYRALRSAELAALTIDSALRRDRVTRADLRDYEGLHRSAFAPGRRVQRALDVVVSSGWLCRAAVARLGRRPNTLSDLISVTGDAEPARRLVAPLAAMLLPQTPRLTANR